MATREELATGLNGLLADYAIYYQKLRNYHWNVYGEAFFQLHAEFERLYTESAMVVDSLAERVSALDKRPYSTLAEYLEVGQLQEDREVPRGAEMVRNLRGDIEVLNVHASEVLAVAEEVGDVPSRSLLEDLIQTQASNAWMLGSYLRRGTGS